jgi:TRAP transporter TAXI family solute receptor
MRKKHPYYATIQLPPNTYKGQTAPVDTLVVMAIWATHDGVTDSMAYEVTKALYENTETLGQVHPKGKEISLKTALQAVSIPLHPGAEKYYREKGPHQVTYWSKSEARSANVIGNQYVIPAQAGIQRLFL